MTAPASNGRNGTWKTWLLGVMATLGATLIGNGILFQRETRESLAHVEERLKTIEGQRWQSAREQITREFARHDQRMDSIGSVLSSFQNTMPTNTEVGQQLHVRDLEIRRLEQRLDRLEKR